MAAVDDRGSASEEESESSDGEDGECRKSQRLERAYSADDIQRGLRMMLAARQQRTSLSASKAAERLQLKKMEKTVRYQPRAPPRGRAAACAPTSPRPPCSPRSAVGFRNGRFSAVSD